jgi:hypothetical protein
VSHEPSEEPIRLPVPVFKEAGSLGKEPDRAQRRKARRSREKRIASKSMKYYFLCVAFFAGLLLVILRIQHRTDHNPPSDFLYVLAQSEENAGNPDGKPVEALGPLAAEKLVSDALGSRPDDLTGRFRLEDGMSPAAAAAMLEDVRRKEGDVSKLQWMGIRHIGDKVIEEVVTERTNDRGVTVRLAQIIHRPDGTHRVDFGSYVRKTSHPWEDILGGKVKTSVVRVNISEYNYHNGVFRDDQKWHSYAFSSPDMDTILYGYAKSGSEEEARLKDILAIDWKDQRAAIEIRKDDRMMPKQFLISRVLGHDWIENDTDNDEMKR